VFFEKIIYKKTYTSQINVYNDLRKYVIFILNNINLLQRLVFLVKALFFCTKNLIHTSFMQHEIIWQHADNLAIFAIFGLSFLFCLYWFISEHPKSNRLFFKSKDAEAFLTNKVLFQRYLGFVLLGLVPAALLPLFTEKPLSDFGINLANWEQSLLWIAGFSLVIVPMNYFNTKKAKHLAQYPQIRTKLWSKKVYYLNIYSWVLYLIGYEFAFRGLLLFGLLEVLNPWLAIAINASIYALAHLPKGGTETFGSFVLGTIFCILTLQTGSILIPLLTHCCLAVSNTIFSFKNHPEISFK